MTGSERTELLVIPDGAAQPLRDGEPTALEAARTPVLDQLAEEGAVLRVATTPDGLPPGSETGIPALLGAAPDGRVGRGRIDAAAHGIDVPAGSVPWRADLHYANGKRASVRQARDVCAHMRGWAHSIGGHRIVLVAPELVQAADLVSEIVKVKHPMDAGIRAQQGIEW